MRVGIHKKIDNLGRVTIPKEYRDFYHLNEQDTICIVDTKEGLLITNPKFKVVEIPLKSLLDIFVDDVLDIGIADDMFNSNETGYIWIEGPQMSEINGLRCAYVKYHTKYNYYYEIHFDRVEGAGRQLEILLEVSKKHLIDIEAVLNRQNVKEFYQSFVLA